MDDCNEQPAECCCGMPAIHITNVTATIGNLEATCEFSACGDGDSSGELLGEMNEVIGEPRDVYEQVMSAILNSFAGSLGTGIRRVVVSEPTPDGPITYLDKSVDGDETPPSMAEIVGE